MQTMRRKCGSTDKVESAYSTIFFFLPFDSANNPSPSDTSPSTAYHLLSLHQVEKNASRNKTIYATFLLNLLL
jgi:hypothetical protein